MKIKGSKLTLCRFALFLLLPFLSVAQTPDALINIINDDGELLIRQAQIDSFLKKNKDTISLGQLADIYHDLGSKWYYRNWEDSKNISDLENAVRVTQKSVDLKRRSDNIEECSLNRTLYNLGYFLYLNNRLPEAIDTYIELSQKGRIYCSVNSNKEDYIYWAMQELGALYLLMGDFYESINSYETLIAQIQNKDTIQSFDYKFLIVAHRELADLYFQIDAKDNLALIMQNLELAEKYLAESALQCCQDQVDINQQYGNALIDVKNYAEALKYHAKALKFLSPEDSLKLAIVHNSLGISYLNLNRDTAAVESFHRAIAYEKHYSDPYNNLGDFYVKKKEFESAMQNYQRAINLEIGGYENFSKDVALTIEDLGYTSEKIPLLNHIVTKANGWINYYKHDNNGAHLAKALETFTLADQLVDLIRFESNEQQSKLYWREQSSDLYMKAVEVCFLMNKPEQAFHFMERNKALLLLEDLTHEEAKDIAQLPKELAQREFKLKRNIFLAENNLFDADVKNKRSIDSIKTTVSESKYVYQKFIDSLNAAFPDYAKYKKKADILSYNEFMSGYITDKSAVIHYILNEDDGYGLTTSNKGSTLFRLEDTEKLNKDIDSLTVLLSSGVSDINTFKRVSSTLFKKLIPEHVYNQIKGKQLIVIPDYTLQNIPFETLVVDQEPLKYLIEEVEVGYGYSLSLIDHSKGNARDHSKQLLGLAPVSFNALGLNELYNSENEVSGIADVFDSEVFLNGQASKENFLKGAEAPQIIHLATHADVGDGENPWIAFSDEKMYLKEIYATKNRSDMVVLSACNTLSGSLKRGEGVMSLARGFFYSGAKSVVSSLWPLTDGTGKDIMISFYQNLKQGQSKSRALREAKLNYLNTAKAAELKHPFYWAGFVVVGDNAPLVNTDNSLWIYLGIATLLLIVFLKRRPLFERLQQAFCFFTVKFSMR